MQAGWDFILYSYYLEQINASCNTNLMTSSHVLFYKSLLQTASSIPIPGSRELNDAFPHLRSLHRKKIKETLAMCYPEYAIIMDGTPIFAEAECVMIRVVHKETKKNPPVGSPSWTVCRVS